MLVIHDPLYAESKKTWYKWTYLQNRKTQTSRAGGKDEGKE